MSQANASAAATTKSRRRWFQFRLQTLLVLVTLTACVLFGARIWHHAWVGTYQCYGYDPSDNETSQRNSEAQMAIEREFTPLLTGIFFIGGGGVWYAITRHDRAVGIGFGVPVALMLLLPLGIIVPLIGVATCAWLLQFPPPPHDKWLLTTSLAAAISAMWPLFWRRYYLAGMVLLYNLIWFGCAISYCNRYFDLFGD